MLTDDEMEELLDDLILRLKRSPRMREEYVNSMVKEMLKNPGSMVYVGFRLIIALSEPE